MYSNVLKYANTTNKYVCMHTFRNLSMLVNIYGRLSDRQASADEQHGAALHEVEDADAHTAWAGMQCALAGVVVRCAEGQWAIACICIYIYMYINLCMYITYVYVCKYIFYTCQLIRKFIYVYVCIHTCTENFAADETYRRILDGDALRTLREFRLNKHTYQ